MGNGSGLLVRRDPGQRTPEAVPRPADRAQGKRFVIFVALVVLLALIAAGLWVGHGWGHVTAVSPPHHPHAPPPAPRAGMANPRLDPDWEGDGKPVTIAFGGDVNFPSGSILGDRLAADPATALGDGVPDLLGGWT